LNGELNGAGSYFYKNGDKYEGEFLEGVKMGKGVYYWSQGGAYEGMKKRVLYINSSIK
jgi:hypothetical protein